MCIAQLHLVYIYCIRLVSITCKNYSTKQNLYHACTFFSFFLFLFLFFCVFCFHLTLVLTQNRQSNQNVLPSIKEKIPWKYHNHEAQPSRGTKRKRDEDQIRTMQTPYMKPQTKKNCKRGIALERSVGKLLEV